MVYASLGIISAFVWSVLMLNMQLDKIKLLEQDRAVLLKVLKEKKPSSVKVIVIDNKIQRILYVGHNYINCK